MIKYRSVGGVLHGITGILFGKVVCNRMWSFCYHALRRRGLKFFEYKRVMKRIVF